MKTFELDLSDPLHARAYLKAASFYLSGWPQEWDAETLASTLVFEDDPQQPKIKLWNPIKEMAADEDTDPYLKSDSMICDLAEEFVMFLPENQ